MIICVLECNWLLFEQAYRANLFGTKPMKVSKFQVRPIEAWPRKFMEVLATLSIPMNFWQASICWLTSGFVGAKNTTLPYMR